MYLILNCPMFRSTYIRRWNGFVCRKSKLVTLFVLFSIFIFLILLALGSLSHEKGSRSSFRHFRLEAKKACETIHIMSVVGGYKPTFDFFVLLKSLLTYRSNPIVLHLLVNSESQLVLSEMLDTWHLPALSYKFYNISLYIDSVAWIPNSHYSKTFGLLKLMAPRILSDVSKVIVLDTDLLLVGDVIHMWKAFSLLRSAGGFFAMVDNQSDWYVEQFINGTAKHWPALGRGFNTGVMLMDLDNLRKSNIDWMSLWKESATRHLKVMESTHLADQDIFNAVFLENRKFVLKVTCQWNYQLLASRKNVYCSLNSSALQVFHFNGPVKISASMFEDGDNSDFDDLVSNRYFGIVEKNGYRFRSISSSCPHISSEKDVNLDSLDDFSPADPCYDIRLETVAIRRVFPFFYSGRLSNKFKSKEKLGLVTQLSFDRIGQLELICRHWKDGAPISAAVYLNDADLTSVIRLLTDDTSCISSGNVHVHLVFRQGVTYPVNFLRNIALKFAKSSEYVLISDADFVPSSEFVDRIDSSLLTNQKTAIVAPAFDLSSFVDISMNDWKLDKSVLLYNMDRGLVQSFQSNKWPAGHAPTNVSRWKFATGAYEVKWAPDYEPYVVIRISESPKFDERFVGFGWNKVSYAMQLDASGFSFMVDPSVFVVHLPHLPSVDLMRFRANTLYQTCLEKLKLEFVNELASRHGASALKYLKAMSAPKSVL